MALDFCHNETCACSWVCVKRLVQWRHAPVFSSLSLLQSRVHVKFCVRSVYVCAYTSCLDCGPCLGAYDKGLFFLN
jgi:hypothetical protein